MVPLTLVFRTGFRAPVVTWFIMRQCPYADALPYPEPVPVSDTCPECLATGSHPVQLRLCLECGHAGCCDSSPGRHATEHHKESGQPHHADLRTGRELALVLCRPRTCMERVHRARGRRRRMHMTRATSAHLQVTRFDGLTCGYVNPARALPI